MKKMTKLFVNIKKEENWLAEQTGWKLVKTNGLRYTFEACTSEYNYEYVYFEKSKKELNGIRQQIIDSDIEFVCHTSSWALFRKEVSKGPIHVYTDSYLKYKTLIKRYKSIMALGICYLCLGSSNIALTASGNFGFGFSASLFYLSSALFYLSAASLKKYASEYDDGTYANRMKRDKK